MLTIPDVKQRRNVLDAGVFPNYTSGPAKWSVRAVLSSKLDLVSGLMLLPDTGLGSLPYIHGTLAQKAESSS